jgi:putative protein-disulfide isomerase
MTTATLHYIYDPLCGWCYGAEPLAWAAAALPSIEMRLHAGELWQEPTRLPEHTRRYIRQADERISRMSGQPFGSAYHDGLFADPTMVLHSRPTIAAVLAAESLEAKAGLKMLKAIQHAHYEHGRRVIEREVLCDLAAGIGLDRAAFEAALDTAPVDAHITASRRLMNRVGAHGFPTFALQIGDQWFAVPHQQFASNPAEFARWLEREVQAHAA